MTLRIAISGSAGTGKTSVGRALAARLEVPFIEESMRRRIAEGLRVDILSPSELADLLREVWEEQRQAEEEAGAHFVVDRSSYDYVAFWLQYGLHHDEARTDAWVGELSSLGERYDRVLLLPWGVLPLEADGIRSTNRWIQFHYQSLLEKTLKRFARRGQVLRVPGEETVEQRVDFVLRFLPVD